MREPLKIEGGKTMIRASSKSLGVLVCLIAWRLTGAPEPVSAAYIGLDFNSLPSAQQPIGPNWVYFHPNNSYPETQIFHVGLNGANEPTLFQNTMGDALPAADGNRYDLSNDLDASQNYFRIRVRAAVLEEEQNPQSPNHFGFTFLIHLGGSGVEIGLGPQGVQATDHTGGFHDVNTTLINTDYHDWVLSGVVGPVGAWRLTRDGVEVATGDFYAAADNLLGLGDGSAGANARVEITKYEVTQSSTGGRIVFASQRDGDFEIYTMNPDGTDVVQLTHNTCEDRQPGWSPDGKKIAWVSDCDGDYEVFVMNADGTDQTQLTFDDVSEFSPSWSPDGSRIAFAQYGNGDIWVMNPDGSDQTQLTSDPEPEGNPRWSPDGSRIAYTRGASVQADVWVMNSDGSAKHGLMGNNFQDIVMGWKPDGSKILFRRQYDYNQGWGELLTINPDGSGEANLTNTIGIYEGEGTYSPDGMKIVFNSNQDDSNFDVYVMNADGSGRVRITNSSGYDGDIDWQKRPVACLTTDFQDFSGDPLPSWYRLASTGSCALPATSGGELVMSVDDVCSGGVAVAQDLILDKGVAKLCAGDFDVSIDYRVVDFVTPPSGFRAMGIEIDRLLDDSAVGFIGRIAQPATACEPTGQFYIAWTDNSSCQTQHFAAANDLEGGFRFVRTGSLGRMLYRSGATGNWTELYSGAVTTDEVYFTVFSGARDVDHQTQDVRFDNLRLGGTTSVPMAGPRATTLQLSAWPRPVRSGRALNLAFDLPRAGRTDLRLFDVSGRRVASRTEWRAAGPNRLTWSLPVLPSGVYLVRMDQGDRRATARLLVVN